MTCASVYILIPARDYPLRYHSCIDSCNYRRQLIPDSGQISTTKILKGFLAALFQGLVQLQCITLARPCAPRDSVRADRPPFLSSPDDPVTPSDPNAIPSIPYQRALARVSPLRHPAIPAVH